MVTPPFLRPFPMGVAASLITAADKMAKSQKRSMNITNERKRTRNDEDIQYILIECQIVVVGTAVANSKTEYVFLCDPIGAYLTQSN